MEKQTKYYNKIRSLNCNKRGKVSLNKLKEARQGMIKIEDVEKMIDDFGKLRLYRSKSCQLLLRRIKQSLQKLGDK